MADAPTPVHNRLAKVKNILLILSGKGGVGKSSCTVQLALCLHSMGLKVGVLDCDLTGPSIPRMFGLDGQSVHQSSDGWVPVYADGSERRLAVMSVGFLLKSSSDSVVWRGPKKDGMIRQFLADVRWGELDYLLIDTPPGTSDEHLSLLTHLHPIPLTSVIVTTPQSISLLDCSKCLSFTRKVSLPVLGLIENMSGYACPCCGEVTNLFSTGGGEAMAKREDVRFLGRLPVDSELVSFMDSTTKLKEDDSSQSEVATMELPPNTTTIAADPEPSTPVPPSDSLSVTTPNSSSTSAFQILENYLKTPTYKLFIEIAKAVRAEMEGQGGDSEGAVPFKSSIARWPSPNISSPHPSSSSTVYSSTVQGAGTVTSTNATSIAPDAFEDDLTAESFNPNKEELPSGLSLNPSFELSLNDGGLASFLDEYEVQDEEEAAHQRQGDESEESQSQNRVSFRAGISSGLLIDLESSPKPTYRRPTPPDVDSGPTPKKSSNRMDLLLMHVKSRTEKAKEASQDPVAESSTTSSRAEPTPGRSKFASEARDIFARRKKGDVEFELEKSQGSSSRLNRSQVESGSTSKNSHVEIWLEGMTGSRLIDEQSYPPQDHPTDHLTGSILGSSASSPPPRSQYSREFWSSPKSSVKRNSQHFTPTGLSSTPPPFQQQHPRILHSPPQTVARSSTKVRNNPHDNRTPRGFPPPSPPEETPQPARHLAPSPPPSLPPALPHHQSNSFEYANYDAPVSEYDSQQEEENEYSPPTPPMRIHNSFKRTSISPPPQRVPFAEASQQQNTSLSESILRMRARTASSTTQPQSHVSPSPHKFETPGPRPVLFPKRSPPVIPRQTILPLPVNSGISPRSNQQSSPPPSAQKSTTTMQPLFATAPSSTTSSSQKGLPTLAEDSSSKKSHVRRSTLVDANEVNSVLSGSVHGSPSRSPTGHEPSNLRSMTSSTSTSVFPSRHQPNFQPQQTPAAPGAWEWTPGGRQKPGVVRFGLNDDERSNDESDAVEGDREDEGPTSPVRKVRTVEVFRIRATPKRQHGQPSSTNVSARPSTPQRSSELHLMSSTQKSLTPLSGAKRVSRLRSELALVTAAEEVATGRFGGLRRRWDEIKDLDWGTSQVTIGKEMSWLLKLVWYIGVWGIICFVLNSIHNQLPPPPDLLPFHPALYSPPPSASPLFTLSPFGGLPPGLSAFEIRHRLDQRQWEDKIWDFIQAFVGYSGRPSSTSVVAAFQ